MRRSGKLAALAAAVVVGSSAAAAGPAAGVTPGGETPSPEALVVGTEHPRDLLALAGSLDGLEMRAARVPRLGAITIAGRDRALALATLRARGDVDYVEPLRLRRLNGEPADAIDPATGRRFDWALDAVDSAGGLAVAGGGSAVAVAVIDSGIDGGHPDLQGRVAPGVDLTGSGSTRDPLGHGTFVAGLIAAIDGNGAGGRGVAGATRVIPIRVTTTGTLSNVTLAAGIVAAVESGAGVINISLGGPALSRVEADALEYARARDVLVVASAGNSAEDGNAIEYPAAAVGGDDGGWSSGLSVAASDPSSRPASFSSHNRHVSIAAPGAGAGGCGDGVYSTIPIDSAPLWDQDPSGCARIFGVEHGAGRYSYAEGTSFSAPLVAGAAALVRGVTPALRADQVGDVLRRSATSPRGGWDEHLGAGILDVGAAAALARTYDVTPPDLRVRIREEASSAALSVIAEDGSAPGREVAGDVRITLAYSYDGHAYAPLQSEARAPLERSFALDARRPLWLRVSACDGNRNCAVEDTGPLDGGAVVAGGVQGVPVGGAATTSGGRGDPAPEAVTRRLGRARVTGLGVISRCGKLGERCARVAWRWSGTRGTAGTYRLLLSQRGGRTLVRRAGTFEVGRRQAVTVRFRGAPLCRTITARLELRTGEARRLLVRRAPVRVRCREPRGR